MARPGNRHHVVQSRKAPIPQGPYAQAIHVVQPGSMLVISAQLPIALPAGTLFAGSLPKQLQHCLQHVRNIVQDAGFAMNEVVRITIYVTSLSDSDALNETYRTFFTGVTLPARTVVQVQALPMGAGVAVEAMAVKVALEQRAAAAPPEMEEYE